MATKSNFGERTCIITETNFGYMLYKPIIAKSSISMIYNFYSNPLALFCFEAVGVVGYFCFLMQIITRYIYFTS